MTPVELVRQLNEPDFQDEVELALMKQALPIAADDSHKAQAYAKSVINSTQSYVRRFALALLAGLKPEEASRKEIVDDVSGQKFLTHVDIAATDIEASIAAHFTDFA